MNKNVSNIQVFTPNLFWDVDEKEFDMDKYPGQIIQRVLEYGHMKDWNIIYSHYGINKIAECCKGLRTLDPKALSFICCISNTNKEDYRCYTSAPSYLTH